MRVWNSLTEVLEDRIAADEGGVSAIAVASHQTAQVLTLLNLAEAGDRVVTSTSLQAASETLFTHALPRLGIRTHLVDLNDLKAVADAIDHQTRAVFFESSGEVSRDRAAISDLAQLAHDFNVPLIVDHRVGSTALKPLSVGADIVLLSASQWLAGPDAAFGSMIIDGGRFSWSATARFQRRFENTGDDARAFSARLRAQLLATIGAPMAPHLMSQLLHAIGTGDQTASFDGYVAGCAA